MLTNTKRLEKFDILCMISLPCSRFSDLKLCHNNFLRNICVAIKKNREIFSQLYKKRINYVDLIPFISL